ncbi:GNAT family N-acetyltransferase [Laceyella sacchari]|uniref:GNAT family N-acetyltransferase n=1 Tax=Laceyella sacchari TaxID=37482 RepID=UPI001304E638|nr:GNAT family N-acetyltransferase [Laceyella sacchari]
MKQTFCLNRVNESCPVNSKKSGFNKYWRAIRRACEWQRISGHLGLCRGYMRRNRHAATIAIGLLQSCCEQGWGTKLLKLGESWVREQQIHRLGLTVITHNERALHLYQKQGFMIESLQNDSLLVNGTYVDMTSKSR